MPIHREKPREQLLECIKKEERREKERRKLDFVIQLLKRDNEK